MCMYDFVDLVEMVSSYFWKCEWAVSFDCDIPFPQATITDLCTNTKPSR